MRSLIELLQGGSESAELIVGLAGAAAAALLLLLFMLLSSRDRQQRQRRLQRVKLPAAGKAKKAPAVSVARSTADSSIVALDQMIKRLLPNPAKMRARLTRTGYKITIGEYLIGCVLIGFIVLAALKLLTGLPTGAILLIALGLAVGLPHLVVGFLGARRKKRFTDLFPEAIDLIIRGLKSGLTVSESIRMVGQEIKDPVGSEFRLVSESVRFGMTLSDALEAAAQRIETAEFNFFIITLAIQQETGGNLAETLENLSTVIRRRRQMRLKIKAFSSEAKASAYIIGSLPFVMFGILLSINFDYVKALWMDPRGLVMVAGGMISHLVGILVMAKMIRFEI